jgi:transcriptional regulator with PAS, ATPase and Fis domain
LFTIVPVALQTIVDHISDSYLVLNEQLEVTDYNKTFADSFGALAAVKRRIPVTELFMTEVSADTAEMFQKLIKAVKEHESSKFEIHLHEKNYDKYFIVEITPVVTSGALICTIILFKDITEQKKDAELIARTQLMLIQSEHLASLGSLWEHRAQPEIADHVRRGRPGGPFRPDRGIRRIG